VNGDECPDCGTELKDAGGSNRFRTQSVNWRVCPECGGFEGVDGVWHSNDKDS
jgi:predicted RNA-binding Zn-ribbon protein involved in translation (DUF1610 family)